MIYNVETATVDQSKLLYRIKLDVERATEEISNSYSDSWLDGAEWGDGSH